MKKIIVSAVVALALVGSVFATTYTNTVGSAVGLPDIGARKIFVVNNTLTLSSATTYAVSNTVSLIQIPSNCAVLAVDVKTSVPVTNATCTVDWGDNSTADQFVSNFNAVTTTNANTISAASTWKVYDAANSVNLRFDHAPGHTGTFITKAVLIDLN